MSKLKKCFILVILTIFTCNLAIAQLRPPAVPLITIDPYMSCWSTSDNLYDTWPQHWTLHTHAMCGLIRIDGSTYRFMGDLTNVDAIPQTDLQVTATQTEYQFKGAGVQLNVKFTSPLLVDDLDLLSRPVNYVTFAVKSIDGLEHDVQVYFDATAEWAVNSTDQVIQSSRVNIPGLMAMKTGTISQNILGRRGDSVRIDWGYLYLAVKNEKALTSRMANGSVCREQFIIDGELDKNNDDTSAKSVKDNFQALSLAFDLGIVNRVTAEKHLMIGYDDIDSIQYFHRGLKAWWARNGKTIGQALTEAANDYQKTMSKCDTFDKKLQMDAFASGGEKYADLCVLVWRQVIAAHKLVADVDGKPLFFSKENNSNGSIGTVDVTYPSTPMFLVYNAELVKGMLEPILFYRESGAWTKNFAAHDVGTYPIANGQTYGGDMPVEECGNMIILVAAIAQVEGNADYAGIHWQVLSEWAQYLKEKGFDPENQLCTDDFAGHLAHNANLSIKAIVGLGCYGKLAIALGHKELGQQYLKVAKEFAVAWKKKAKDGDHYSLTFDKKGTWSQKYNLVWDEILDLNLFDDDIADDEIAYYLKIQNKYGLPLDSRRTYTKSDWVLWTAAMTDNKKDFDAIVDPMWKYVDETPSRVPLSDWHETPDGRCVGFRARSVLGGYFMKMLADKNIKKSTTVSFDWNSYVAPKIPVYEIVIPTSLAKPSVWKYTFNKPADNWFMSDFDDSSWKSGKGIFGTAMTPAIGDSIGTTWNTDDIYMRRTIELPKMKYDSLRLRIFHDEDTNVYINGVLAASLKGYTATYVDVKLNPQAVKAIRPGQNIISVRCHQTMGGQGVDLGFSNIVSE
ncbi:MAG: DUF4965 domain-containing protein [Phycisphaerae bacterium]|nr:DUF4965 domain-containing protein [Phycisphaerae bacterium]